MQKAYYHPDFPSFLRQRMLKREKELKRQKAKGLLTDNEMNRILAEERLAEELGEEKAL